MFSISSV